MKKMKKILILVLVLLLVAALAVAAVFVLPDLLNKTPEGPATQDALIIDDYPVIPSAFLKQEYDLRDAIRIEEGVTYTATALYVDYDDNMSIHEVPVNDLKFTPTALYEVVVTVSAQRGEETAQKVLYIPVSIIADPIDQTFSSKGSAAWADDGIVKTVTINQEHIKAENSSTALEISFNGSSAEYYGTTLGILTDKDLMDLYADQIWENAVVQFWVYNPMEAPIEFQLRITDNMTGLNTEWSQEEEFPYRQVAMPGEWTLCLFSLRAQGTIHRLGNKEGLYLKTQYQGMPGLDVNYSFSFIMDGLDVVDAANYPDLYTTFTKSTETLDQGWENLPLDTGWQGTDTVFVHDIMMGEGSTCSLKATFDGPKGLKEPFISFSPQWAVAYGKLRELPDMSGGTLTAYFKFENMTPYAELDLTNLNWESTNSLPFTMKELGDGWYEGTIDLYDLEFAAAERSDNIIRFNINFPKAKKNSVVYVDTMKFHYKEVTKAKEPGNKDWINLPVDGGMSDVGVYKYNSSKLKASGSTRSIYVKANSGSKGTITFSQEWGVRYKTLDSLPDMRSGVLHAYFYFGSQAPKATAQIFNKEWGNSTEVEFIFESAGNGWYYGSIPNVLFKGFEKGNAKDIIRIEIGFPAGYTVYIDGLMSYPKESYAQKVDLEDLLGTGIVGVANLTSAAGSKTVTDVTNGSADAMYIYTTGDTNYPLLTSRFVLPVDATGWDNLSFDMLADNASTWVGMRVYYQDASGADKTASVGTDITAGSWNTVTVDLSAFKNVNWKKVTGFGLQFNMDKEDGGLKTGTNKIYIDNWKLTKDAALPADPDDLLGDATLTGGTFHSNPALYQAENDLTVKNGATSTRSWKFSVKEKAWPSAQFTFANVQDLTDKTLQLDVKLTPIADTSDPFERIDMMLLGANGASLHEYILNKDIDNGVVTANSDGWYTITLDLTALDIDRSAVYGIQFRFNFDQFEAIYVDNMKVVDQAQTEPEPEPEPPTFIAEDLIASSVIDPVSGLTVELVTDKTNGSEKALYIHSETPCGYPVVKLMFAEAQDISAYDNLLLDGCVTTASKWIGLRLYYLDANGDEKTAGFGMDLEGEAWSSHSFKLSDFAGADLTKVVGVGLCLNFHVTEGFVTGQNNQMWIDNLKLTQDPEEIPADPDDLLADATMTGGNYINSPDVYRYDPNSNVVNGTESTRSWKLSAESGWPQALITFAQPLDMTNKALQFDVKFVAPEDKTNRWIGIYLLDSNGNKLFNSQPVDDCKDGSVTPNAEGWYTVTLNFGTLDFDRTDVATLYLCFDFDSMDEVYLDNMKLVDWTPPAPEPEPPTFTAEDLIASSVIDPVSGLTVELVTDKTNGSEKALYIHSETPCGYPVVKLMFAEAQDISAYDNLLLDGCVTTASKWIGLRLYYLDANGDEKTAGFGMDLEGEAWSSHSFKLTDFAGADLTKVVGVGLCLNFHVTEGFVTGQNNQMWIDNLKLTQDPEEIPSDPDDLLADATMTGGNYINSPDVYKHDPNSNVVNGAASTRSWKLSAEAGWPQALITFAQPLDMTNKALQFDVKFVAPEGKTNRWIGIYLLDSNGNKLFNSQPVDDCKDGSVTPNAEGWYTVALNFGTLDFDRTDVATLYLCFDFDSMDEVYLDNMKLVDWTPPAPAPEFDPSDVMPQSQITGITNSATMTVETVTDDTFYSTDAVKVSTTAKNGWPVLKFMFEEEQDLSDFDQLTFAAKSVDASKWLGLRIFYLDANDETKTASKGFDLSGNDAWEQVFVSLSDFSGLDKSRVVGVGFCFNFDDGFKTDKTNILVIDAVGFSKSETVAADWTNMRVDSGYSAGSYYMDVINVKAENSGKSLKLIAPAAKAGIAALNSQWAAADGSIAARPDFTAGTVGAWFYFGSQTPEASLAVVNAAWNESNFAPFTFGEGEDGWYYGTVDVSTITFNTTGATAADVLRIRVSVPAGYTVNIDGMTYTKPVATEETEIASDLLASAKMEWTNMKSGIDSWEVSDDVNGDQSLRSWKFSTSGASGGNGWPVFQLKLDKSYDFTGKDLVLDIKFENSSQWFAVSALENSSWVKVGGSYGNDVTGSGWQTVTIDLSSKIVAGKTLEDVYLISFCFNFEDNAGQPQTVWIDNVHLVDAE